jgi:hypothetical protein
MAKNTVLIWLLILMIAPSQSIYCKVGYGQQIKQPNKYIDFWSKTLVSTFHFHQFHQ